MSDLELPEYILLFILLLYSAGMFVQSYTFSYGAAIFPRYLSGILIIGCLLLLALSVTNSSIKDSMFDVFDSDTELEVGGETTPIAPHHEILVLTSLLVIFGYFVGFLWVAPIFTFVYLTRVNKSLRSRVIMTAIVAGIGLVFLFVLDAPIDSGVVDLIGVT